MLLCKRQISDLLFTPLNILCSFTPARIPKRFLLSKRLFVFFWPLRTCDTCLDPLTRCPAKINCLAGADHYPKSQDLHKYCQAHCAADRFCRLFYVTVEQFRHCICIYLQAALEGPSREQSGSSSLQTPDTSSMTRAGLLVLLSFALCCAPGEWLSRCPSPGCLQKDKAEDSKREKLLQRALLPWLASCRLQGCISG